MSAPPIFRLIGDRRVSVVRDAAAVWRVLDDDPVASCMVAARVAVMGCVVNGPGEAREADLGVASGNGKGQIFVRGEVIKTVPEAQIVETLIEEAMRMASEMGTPDATASGSPVVTVS